MIVGGERLRTGRKSRAASIQMRPMGADPGSETARRYICSSVGNILSPKTGLSCPTCTVRGIAATASC